MSDYVLPSIGGALIGLAAIIMLLLLGRITGISGIFWQALSRINRDMWTHWSFLFLIGLILGTAIVHYVLQLPLPVMQPASSVMVILAGLLVGFGTRLGNGCTSGHGVCGIGRLSLRSIVATLVFMAVAILTVFITRHIMGAA